MAITDNVVQLRDSLFNWVSGLGTAKDKSTTSRYFFMPMDQGQLEAAYRGDWVSKKIVNIPAKDATREWRSWQASDDQIEKIEEVERALSLQKKTKQGLQLGRLYGGGLGIMGVNRGQPDEPLDVESVRQGDLKFLHILGRYDVTSGEIEYDITSPWYGQPKWYERRSTGNTSGSQRIHPSRVVRFLGSEMPGLSHSGVDVLGWSDSILQSVDVAVRASGLAAQGVAALIHEMKLDVIQVPDFTQTVSTQKGRDNLTARFTYANVAKSTLNALILDAKEVWNRNQLNLAGMPDLIKVYILLASGAADIPVTRMLGQSPAGLNATGEHDLVNYYDSIKSDQNTELRPVLSPLDEVMLRSTFGDRDPKIHYDWRPLWQMNEVERATVGYQKAQAFKIDVDSGLFPDAVLAEVRANQLVEDGFYPGLEDALDNFDFETFLGTPEEQKAKEEEAAAAATAALAKPAVTPVAANSNAKRPAPGRAVGDWHTAMSDRMRMVADANPRTVYVRRDVLNQRDLADWARGQGFTTVRPDMHVTIMYSKVPVDWLKLGTDFYGNTDDKGRMTIPPGGPRIVEEFGDGAVVLGFASSDLRWRHESMKDKGCQPSYDDYNPHVTITYDGAPENLTKVEPYQGKIVLGPEVFEEIKDGSHLERMAAEVDA